MSKAIEDEARAYEDRRDAAVLEVRTDADVFAKLARNSGLDASIRTMYAALAIERRLLVLDLTRIGLFDDYVEEVLDE